MNYLFSVWKRISFIGVSDTSDFLSNRRIILCNQLCAFTIADTLLYEVLFISIGIHTLVFIHTCCLALYSGVLLLNKHGHYQPAKITLIVTVGVEVFFISLMLGTKAGIFLYFFPYICGTFIVVDYKEKGTAILVGIITLLLIAFLLLPVHAQAFPPIVVSDYGKHILFLATLTTAVLITILCSYHMLKVNFLAEEQLKEVVANQENLNVELMAREEALSATIRHLSLLTKEIDSEKARLSAIVESTDHLIWSVDTDYRFIYCNSNFRKLFKQQYKVELNPGDGLIGLVPDKEVSRWKLLIDQAITGKKFSEEIESWSAIFEVNFNPIIESDKVVGSTVFMQNITARKKAEKEIITAKEKAEQASLAKAQFLSTISHEIRTPMNGVIGMAHLLLAQNPRPDQLELLQALHFSSENLLSLINDILDFQKIEAGKITFEEIAFSARGLLHNIIQSFKFKADEKGIGLQYEVDEKLPECLIGDPVRLTQILNNLIGNAVKFTEQGKVCVAMLLEQDLSDHCTVQFSVTDTGVGIPADKLQAIFEAFTQANADTTRKYGGTGLGLTITKRLLEWQGSQIRVESSPGIGSRFYFDLRFRTNTSMDSRLTTSFPVFTRDLSAIRLLLVEDNLINVMLAEKFLLKWNIVPDHAPDGKVALEKVQEKNYDLVLMDLQMPRMNGVEATQEIRRLGGQYATLPIIALTADVMANAKEQSLAAGMNDFLIKPYSHEDLYSMLTRYSKHTTPSAPWPGSRSSNTHAATPPVCLQKLYELAAGDAVFARQMILACKESLREFRLNFMQAMQQKDAQVLKNVNHKAKALINLLDLSRVQELLDQSEQIVSDHTASEQQVTEIISHLSELCDFIQQELDGKLLPE